MNNEQYNCGIICDKACDKIDYVKYTGRKKLSDFKDDRKCIILWRVGLLKRRKENTNICFHHKKLFGKIFERRSRQMLWCFKNIINAELSHRCPMILKQPKIIS